MFDLGISQLTVIGIVALIVVGPEKLPSLARTLGTLIGRAQRYVSNFKAEMNHVSGLNELRQMQQTVAQTAYDIEHQVNSIGRQAQQGWPEANDSSYNSYMSGRNDPLPYATTAEDMDNIEAAEDHANWQEWQQQTLQDHYPMPYPAASRKNWRMRRSKVPHWYKARNKVRTRVQSSAARAALIHKTNKPQQGAASHS